MISYQSKEFNVKHFGKCVLVVCYDVDTREILGVSEKFTLNDAKNSAMKMSRLTLQNKNRVKIFTPVKDYFSHL